MKHSINLLLIILIASYFSCLKSVASSGDFNKKMKSFAGELKLKYGNPPKKKRLAVIPFVNEGGKRSHLGVYIANSLQEYIFDKNLFTLLERDRLDSILGEFRFNQSGLVAKLSEKKLGKLLGADIVLLGTIADNTNSFKITGKITDLQTGTINSIAGVNIKKTEALKKKFDNYIIHQVNLLKGAYEIIIKEIKVKKSKADGNNWDVNPTKPDIYFRIIKNNKQVYTNSRKPSNNTYIASFRDDIYKVIIEEDDILEIIVEDKDHLEDDRIGTIILTPLKLVKIFKKDKNSFSFDQVEEMKIEMRRID
jgi:TolB-like protein